jgi:hypothetical protein
MDNVENEIWRMVPPEEKFELLAQAQSKGVFAALIGIIVFCTLAVSLKMSWLIWTSFLVAPFIFQFASGKEWRKLRPRTLLEYLAARSASRRFAFSIRSKDLAAKMIFKGTLEKVYGQDHIQEAMEAIIANNAESKVWISLFGDAFTMISEKAGGADLKLGHLIDNKLKLYSEAASDKEYSDAKGLIIKITSRDGDTSTYKLTSKYPAALMVFEKKLKQIQATSITTSLDSIAQDLAVTASPSEDDDRFNSLFSF